MRACWPAVETAITDTVPARVEVQGMVVKETTCDAIVPELELNVAKVDLGHAQAPDLAGRAGWGRIFTC